MKTQTEVENSVPFSDAPFWQQQRDFYCSQGIEAWANKVPYNITNNTFLAEAYFQSVIAFWVESSIKPDFIKDEPFYIIEFGTGPGLFSFYLLKRLAHWHEETQPDFSFVYIMSDLAKSNVDFWKDHPALQDYIHRGILDFALVDAEASGAFQTEIKSINVNPRNPVKNALVTVSNYLLDTLQYELLHLTDGKIMRGWVTHNQVEDYVDFSGENTGFITPEVQFIPLQTGEMDNYKNMLEKVMEGYAALQSECVFFFPSGALTFFENILSFSNNNVLMLITDKGNYKHKDFTLNFRPAMARHHSTSIDVPFDILEMWAVEKGGKAIVSETSLPVQNAGLLLSTNISALPFTAQMLNCQFRNCASGNKYQMFAFYTLNKSVMSFTDVLTCLHEMQWDTFVFNELFPALFELIKSGNIPVLLLADFIDGIRKIADQYYYLPETANTLANIASIFQELGHFDQAIYYYQQSLQQFGSTESTCFNIGVCCMTLQEWEAAKEWLSIVVTKNPENLMARGCLDYCIEHSEPVN